jgi:hypothetical protein
VRLNRPILIASCFCLLCLDHPGSATGQQPGAFRDIVHPGPQSVPGRVKCAYYDMGGEGVAYHDTDAKNNGSGALNPADGSYLNEFRKSEGVDTSYTKFRDEIDKNPFNLVRVEDKQLYVGWTEPGEWFNITVKVEKEGTYALGLMYTSNRGGSISFDVDGKPITGPLTVTSTFNSADPLAWRQWHHWNKMERLAEVRLLQGTHVLTVHVVDQGNMNFDYVEFTPTRAAGGR